MIEKNLQTLFTQIRRVFLSAMLLACTGIGLSLATDDSTIHFTPEETTGTLVRGSIALDLKNKSLLADSLAFSVDHPTLLLNWKALQPASEVFDPVTQDSRKAYVDKPSFEVQVERKDDSPYKALLHVNYMLQNDKNPHHVSVELAFKHQEPTKPVVQTPVADEMRIDHEAPPVVPIEQKPMVISRQEMPVSWTARVNKRLTGFMADLKNTFSHMMENAKSLGLQLVLAFGLGLLMSLTPCIYPMIPVTVGLLQGSGQSFGRQLFRSIAYVTGIASTFSLLGFLVASGVSRYGAFMNNPWFILGIVILLGYLAFSLFDFYPMYIPRFLNSSTEYVSVQNTSLVAPFFFGIVTGTVASPCLSPGLMLLLAIVAKTESTWRGLLLLFAFGIGSSFPLLIVSIFSQALSYLPRAGGWMVEVKKLFGLMLLVTCFYYLKAILPLHYVLWLAAIVSVVLGVYYAAAEHDSDSKYRRIFKYGISIALIALGVFCALQALKIRLLGPVTETYWSGDYQGSYTQALHQGKKVLVELSADWCSLCKLVEQKVLSHIDPKQDFAGVVPVRINCGQGAGALCKELMDKFGIQGIPAMVLIDPATGKTLHTWASELIEYTPERLIREVEHYSA